MCTLLTSNTSVSGWANEYDAECVEQVQVQFPQDNLCLNDHLDNMVLEVSSVHINKFIPVCQTNSGGGVHHTSTQSNTLHIKVTHTHCVCIN